MYQDRRIGQSLTLLPILGNKPWRPDNSNCFVCVKARLTSAMAERPSPVIFAVFRTDCPARNSRRMSRCLLANVSRSRVVLLGASKPDSFSARLCRTRMGSPAQRLDFISRDLSEQRQHDPGCRIPLGVFWTEKAVDNAPARLYSLLPFAIHPAINVGLWLSLVERFVRVEEVESSNLSSPTTYFAWPKYVPLSSFLRCPTQPPAPH
jgi:hypothetical protein